MIRVHHLSIDKGKQVMNANHLFSFQLTIFLRYGMLTCNLWILLIKVNLYWNLFNLLVLLKKNIETMNFILNWVNKDILLINNTQ